MTAALIAGALVGCEGAEESVVDAAAAPDTPDAAAPDTPDAVVSQTPDAAAPETPDAAADIGGAVDDRCVTDDDCPDPLLCASEIGRCVPRCQADIDCPGERICDVQTGRCRSGEDPPPDPPPSIHDAEGSAFGVFAVFTREFGDFARDMGMDEAAYREWAGAHMNALGAGWTRSNLQLMWDAIEPDLGGAFNWDGSMGGEPIFEAAARYGVGYLGVFHEGSGPEATPDPRRSVLRNPLDDVVAYQRFVRAAVERYDGDGVDDSPAGVVIKHWQVGNETAGWSRQGRTTDHYIEWFVVTAEAIREADPESKVVLVASTDGLRVDPMHREVIEALVARGVRFDGIDIHHWGTAAQDRMDAVPEYRALLAAAGVEAVEIWSGEHGTYVGAPVANANPEACTPACGADQVCAVAVGRCVDRCQADADCRAMQPRCDVEAGLCGPPEQSPVVQARSLVRRYVINRALGVTRILWNNLVAWRCFSGRCGGLFDRIGLIADGYGPGEGPDDIGTPRVAYHAYAMLAARTDNTVAEQQGEIDTGVPGVAAYGYRHRAEGWTGYVAWADADDTVVSLDWPSASAQVVSLITDGQGAPLRDEIVAAVGGQLQIAIGSDPVWIAPEPGGTIPDDPESPEPPATRCNDGDGCPDGQVCLEPQARCVPDDPENPEPPATRCNDGDGCPDGQVCLEPQARCVPDDPENPEPPATRCNDGDGCPDGQVCLEPQARCVPDCRQTHRCPPQHPACDDATGLCVGEDPQPPDGGTHEVTSEIFEIINPASGHSWWAKAWFPVDGDADHRYPTVVTVPGGIGAGSQTDQRGDPALLAAEGFVVVIFDADGRGHTPGEEDQGGHTHQDGLATLIEAVAERPEVDPTQIGLSTSSYGITMGSGTLARYPDLPVRFLCDWEGPANRDDTGHCDPSDTGHIQHPCDDDAWWAEREASEHIRHVQVPYLRIQSARDHAQPDNRHAILMVNHATSAPHGGRGLSPWTRVNDADMNAPNATYTEETPPQYFEAPIDRNAKLASYWRELFALDR